MRLPSPLPPGEGQGEGVDEGAGKGRLRRNATEAERELWKYLRAHRMAGYKFRRQYAIGSYIVDFAGVEARLVIEADGGQHLEQEGEDRTRTEYLESLGYRVLRFWNDEILVDTQTVLETIHTCLNDTSSPQPSPGGRGG
ncbi:MAG: endonuclease domain-containing protein [Gammaproteobacteria bacterium]